MILDWGLGACGRNNKRKGGGKFDIPGSSCTASLGGDGSTVRPMSGLCVQELHIAKPAGAARSPWRVREKAGSKEEESGRQEVGKEGRVFVSTLVWFLHTSLQGQ